MRWWVASPISRPPPSAVPFMAATTGMPRVSSRRMRAAPSRTCSNQNCASSGRASTSAVRSPPAKKVFFAEVRMTPLIPPLVSPVLPSFTSLEIQSTNSPIASLKRWFMVFALLPGSSRVTITMPSSPFSQRTALPSLCELISSLDPSDSLEDGCDAHAAADAQRDQTATQVAALQLVDDRADEHGAGGAERVAHGDGAAVDVGLLVRDVEVLHEPHGDRGEGLVDLEQVDVVGGEAGLGQCLAG